MLRSWFCAATRSMFRLWFRARFIFPRRSDRRCRPCFAASLRILVQIFNQVPFGLITRPEIKRLEDLKGTKIAVTFGGSTYSLLIALFAKHGLAQNFAEYINIPDNPSKVLALQQGRVVAALMAPPTDQPLLKAGFKRLLYGGDEFKDVPFSALLATAKTIKEEPDLTE